MVATFVTIYMRQETTWQKEEKDKEKEKKNEKKKEDKNQSNRQVVTRKKDTELLK